MIPIKKYFISGLIVSSILFISWLLPPIKHICPVNSNGIDHAEATSQWSRKYGMSCNTCHTAFPRLNYFGEQFMRNGYQIPGTEDGDEAGKTLLGENLNLGALGDIFGIRLNLTPIRVQSNDLTKDGTVGAKHRVSLGNPNWVQLFTAGSIYKNVSIFIETEIGTDGDVHSSWFRFGFHNLIGPQGLTNLYVGQLAPLEFTSAAGRLRMLPIQNLLFRVRTSNNTGEDSVRLAGSRPGALFFGNTGPLVYSAGIENGDNRTDPNQYKNYFGSVKLEKTSDVMEGSSISMFAYSGKDTKDTATQQKVSDFYRVNPSINIRHGNWDVVGAFVYGEDDNWTLDASSSAVKTIHRGGLAQVGYRKGKWYGVLQWDIVDSRDVRSLDQNILTPSLWYLPRENWKIGILTSLDLLTTNHPTHVKEKHDFLINIRTMF